MDSFIIKIIVVLIMTVLLAISLAAMLKKKTPRLWYLFVFLLFLEIEVLIALFVHDRFIRPYLGDALVVFVVYFLVKTVIPRKIKWLPLAVFAFACMIEFLQLINILEIIGLEHNGFLRIVLGTSFDWNDIICYGEGCLILYFLQRHRPSVF